MLALPFERIGQALDAIIDFLPIDLESNLLANIITEANEIQTILRLNCHQRRRDLVNGWNLAHVEGIGQIAL